MSQQPEANNEAPEVTAEAVEQQPRPYGKRNPYAYIEQRQQRLYRRQLDGLSARQLVLEHAEREGCSVATAWRDWEVVNQWNAEDWDRDRANMLASDISRKTLIDEIIKADPAVIVFSENH